MLRGFRNWSTLLALFFRLPISRPAMLELRESGLTFLVRTALEAWLVKEVAIERQYEAASVRIQNGWTVIDVGGGIGEFAIDVASRNPDSKVLAYEPAPDSFSLLQENIGLNHIRNLRAFPFAVSASGDQVELRRPAGQGPLTRTSREGFKASTPSVTLEGILSEQKVARCDFLKIDCEGCEYDILLTASPDTLRRIAVLCLEYHDHITGRSHDDLTDHLEAQGFEVSIVPSPVHRGLGLLSAVRRELAA